MISHISHNQPQLLSVPTVPPSTEKKNLSISNYTRQLSQLPNEIKQKIAFEFLDTDSYKQLRSVNKELHKILPSFKEMKTCLNNGITSHAEKNHQYFLLELSGQRKINNAFSTRLNEGHFPTIEQKKTMSDLLDKLKNTDSLKDIKIVSADIKAEADKMYKEIHWMRKNYFEIKNIGTDKVYGQLANNYQMTDQYRYIRALIHYEEVSKNLEALCHEMKIPSIFIEPLAGPLEWELIGDLNALDDLMNGITKGKKGRKITLPDLTYNRGQIQF